MDSSSKWGFGLLRQWSLGSGLKRRASGSVKERGSVSAKEPQNVLTEEQLGATLQLLFYAANGKVNGVREMLDKNVGVDAADFDERTALHVAACDNRLEVVKLLLKEGASVNAEDRWGSTPLADAQLYGNLEICNILEEHGAKLAESTRNYSLMRISSALVPEYEIDHSTLDFSIPQPKGTSELYRAGIWQGTKVWVKLLPGINCVSNDKVASDFKDELDLLLKLRHPNVVQFLGAVTQASPLMIVTEFLSGGDLKAYMEERKRSINVEKAISFGLDIARGLNYLHEHKPESIIHGDLKPSNLLLDDETSGHIKVANFGLSKSVQQANTLEDSVTERHQGSFCRYRAPEMHEHKKYDKSVDIFAFGLILQEMLEGHPPFPDLKDGLEVAKAYVSGKRPLFRHGRSWYPAAVKELIQECQDKEPSRRPSFRKIIPRLQAIQSSSNWTSKLKCFFPGVNK